MNRESGININGGVNHDKIAKLEVLLNRVITRASVQRIAATLPVSPASSAVRAPETVPPPISYPELPAPPAPQLDANAGAGDDAMLTDAADIEVDELFDTDIEVTADEVEVDVDVYDEVRSATESGAQLVAAPPDRAEVTPITGPQVPPLVHKAHEAGAAIKKGEETAAAATATKVPGATPSTPAAMFANELQEQEKEAPASSRRPVTAEPTTTPTYETEAYEANEANETSRALRLTPPPESGRQVAAPPVEPGTRQSPTAPPPAGYGATGGWREPGVPTGPGFDLRSPTSAAVTPMPPAPPLAPEHINPELPASIDVTELISTTQAFKPANFGELLDATLSL